MVVLACGDTELATWVLAPSDPVDLSLVDELARLQLAARRVGCSIHLRNAGPELTGLLAFVGLAEAVAGVAPAMRPTLRQEPALRVEREAEGGEQRGVEEVVMPDDPVA